jgi:hypothetical protein
MNKELMKTMTSALIPIFVAEVIMVLMITAFMHEYDLPDSQLTKGGQLFRDKLLAVRDRIYKKAQSDLFKELEDELNKKLNNQHFRTTDFKFIAGYREAIKEMLQALKSSKGIE